MCTRSKPSGPHPTVLLLSLAVILGLATAALPAQANIEGPQPAAPTAPATAPTAPVVPDSAPAPTADAGKAPAPTAPGAPDAPDAPPAPDAPLALPETHARGPQAGESDPAPAGAAGPGGRAAQTASLQTADAAPDTVWQAVAIAAPSVALAWLAWRLAVVAAGSRLERKEVTRHPMRREILDHVAAHPGATAAELRRVLGVGPSRVAYHLAILRREDQLRARRIDGKRRFFAAGAPAIDPQHLSFRDLTRPEAQTGRIVSLLCEAPGTSLSELARRLGVSPGMAHYHVQKLDDVGIVKRERRGRRVRHYLTQLGHDVCARFVASHSRLTSAAGADRVSAPSDTRSANAA